MRTYPAGVAVPVDGRVHRVASTWYVPDTDPIGLVWVQHGFARSGARMAALAARLCRAGLLVWVPTLSTARTDGCTVQRVRDNRPFLRGIGGLFADPDRTGPLAQALRASTGQAVRLPAGWAAVGHSAGAEAVAYAAGTAAADPHPRRRPPGGVVLLDPVPSARGDNLAVGLAALTAVPVHVVAAEPGRCNRGGVGTDAVRALRDGFVGVRLTRGTHTDAEGPSTDRWGTWACGATDPERFAVLATLTTAWAAQAAAGADGASAAPGGDYLGAALSTGSVTLL